MLRVNFAWNLFLKTKLRDTMYIAGLSEILELKVK